MYGYIKLNLALFYNCKEGDNIILNLTLLHNSNTKYLHTKKHEIIKNPPFI